MSFFNNSTSQSMEILTYYLVLLLLLPPLLLFIIIKHYTCRRNSPPSPPSLPVIGHLHHITDPLYQCLTTLASRYGPIFSLQLGFKSFLIVSSPSAVEECFTKNDTVFANRPHTMAGDHLTYNYISLAWLPYGDIWKTFRRLSMVELFSPHTLQKSAKLREQEIRKIVRVLCRICDNQKKKVDLNNLMTTYICNMLMRGLLGKVCVAEEDIGGKVGREAVKRMKETLTPSNSFGLCDYFPVLRWIGYKGLEKKMRSLHEKRDEFGQSLIDEYRGRRDVVDDMNKSCMIETLLCLQESEPEFYTEDVVKSVLQVMLSAGIGTSITTLEWGMTFLLSHPDELRKLRQEIDDNIGHDHLLNDSDLANLPYLRCIVNETLRLYPSAPLLLPHYSSQDCLVSGYHIPKGTILLANAWAMHRDPNLWEEPDKFNPERFRGVEIGREGCKYIPFGIGRRVCPGAGMALRSVSLALGVLIQCFDWEKPCEDTETEFEDKAGFALHKVKVLEAVCVPRNEAALLLSKLS